ncbi:MAG: hypothetical protein V3S43_03780 [Acidimicrobiia bacterium]
MGFGTGLIGRDARVDSPIGKDLTTPTRPNSSSHYRIAELQFADHSAYESYLGWFRDNPIPPERGPAGRTQFGFYVLTDSVEAIRET